VICGRAGEIARIAVAHIIAEGAYAGFRVLGSDGEPDGGASDGRAAVRALEHFLAGVSARAQTEQERQERAAARGAPTAGPPGDDAARVARSGRGGPHGPARLTDDAIHPSAATRAAAAGVARV
jgi:hypothetical protein